MYAKNLTQITGLTAATWNVANLGSYLTVEPGSTFALILAIRENSTAGDFGAREVGSSDAVRNDSRVAATYLLKLNGSNQVELYGTQAAYYVIGVGDDINFITPFTKSLSASPSWQTIDLSGDGLPAEAAYVVCRSVGVGPAAGDFAYRATGETFDTFGTDVEDYNRTGEEAFVVPLDAADTFQVHNANAAGQSISVIGWLPSEKFVWRVDPTLRTPSAASTWEDFPDVEPTVAIAMIDQKSTGSTANFAWYRKEGSSAAAFAILPKHCTTFVETNAGAIEMYDAKSSGLNTNAAFRGGFKLTAPGSGSLAATEAGADIFESTGAAGSKGIRLELRDTDTGALHANLTGLIVSVRASSNAAATLYSTTSGTTNESGVYVLPNDGLGNVGDYVYATVEKSDHSIGALFRIQIIDLIA